MNSETRKPMEASPKPTQDPDALFDGCLAEVVAPPNGAVEYHPCPVGAVGILSDPRFGQWRFTWISAAGEMKAEGHLKAECLARTTAPEWEKAHALYREMRERQLAESRAFTDAVRAKKEVIAARHGVTLRLLESIERELAELHNSYQY